MDSLDFVIAHQHVPNRPDNARLPQFLDVYYSPDDICTCTYAHEPRNEDVAIGFPYTAAIILSDRPRELVEG